MNNASKLRTDRDKVDLTEHDINLSVYINKDLSRKSILRIILLVVIVLATVAVLYFLFFHVSNSQSQQMSDKNNTSYNNSSLYNSTLSSNDKDDKAADSDSFVSNYLLETDQFRVISKYYHDSSFFTEGLFIINKDYIIESTGLYQKSKLVKYKLGSNSIDWSISLDKSYFGEGSCLYKNKILQLTYKERVMIVYDFTNQTTEPVFEKTLILDDKIFEGWGLTTDGDKIFISDSTDTLKIVSLSDSSVVVESTIKVHDSSGNTIDRINEMEYINGKIYSNIWLLNTLLIINPLTGLIEKKVDLTALTSYEKQKSGNIDVLNGIAYSSQYKGIFVTGKLWNNIYLIEIK